MAEVSNRKFELLDCGADTCCGVVAQSQKKEQKLHPSVLLDALNVPPMAVDSDGTLHFGPRTVPLPALSSPEARRSYTRQMWQRAQTSAARGGLASARILENTPPPAAGGSKETALKLYPVLEERIDAWNGTGPYAKDRKQRRNYRVIAVIRTTTYMLASAGRKSGITSLKQIQDRAQPTWIVGGNDLIFDYYAIKVEDLKAKGGGIMPPEGSGPEPGFAGKAGLRRCIHRDRPARETGPRPGVRTSHRATGPFPRCGPADTHGDAAQPLDLCPRRRAGRLRIRRGQSAGRTPPVVSGAARTVVFTTPTPSPSAR